MSPPRPPRRPLGRLVVWGSAGIAATTALVVAGVMLALLHAQVHHQTDELLVQMTTAEARRILDGPPDEPISADEAAIPLPGLEGPPVARSEAVFDADCRPLATSPDLSGRPLSSALCRAPLAVAGPRVLDLDDGPEVSLRGAVLAVAAPQRAPDGALGVFVGVDHARIDESTWLSFRFGLVVSVLLVLGVGFGAAAVARRLTRDLTHLGGAATELIARGGDVAGLRAAAERFTVSGAAPAEVAALATTLNALVTRLARALDAQARFVAEAAHELRTPLTALRGELEVALRRDRSKDEYRAALEDAATDARRLSDLAEHLLEAASARSDALPVAEAPLRPLVEASLARLARTLSDAGVDATLVDEAPDLAAELHALSTSRILENLLQNAALHAAPARLAVRIAPGPPGWVDVVLTDDGPGVAPDVAEHLFTPFVRAGHGRGHGLGLTIARDLARRQGGELTHEVPEGGRGTRWRLRLRAPNGAQA